MAPATNHCVPEAREALAEALQRALIPWYSEVAEVSLHDSPQPGAYHLDREMHPLGTCPVSPSRKHLTPVPPFADGNRTPKAAVRPSA